MWNGNQQDLLSARSHALPTRLGTGKTRKKEQEQGTSNILKRLHCWEQQIVHSSIQVSFGWFPALWSESVECRNTILSPFYIHSVRKEKNVLFTKSTTKCYFWRPQGFCLRWLDLWDWQSFKHEKLTSRKKKKYISINNENKAECKGNVVWHKKQKKGKK